MDTKKYKCTLCGTIQQTKKVGAMLKAGFALRHLNCKECGRNTILENLPK